MSYELYTTNFANASRFGIQPISISRYSPRGFAGLEYVHLMPSAQLLESYKVGGDWADYCHTYFEGLSVLSSAKVLQDLEGLAVASGLTRPVIACYEHDPLKCHRSLAGLWLQMTTHIHVKELTHEDVKYVIRPSAASADSSLLYATSPGYIL